ncbi:MAG: Fic family protein [Acidobacteria bacterium]|nr:Fic family protein [Acidobacteriota bacterium]
MPRWTVRFHPYVDLRDTELLGLVARIEAIAGLLRDVPLPPGLRRDIDRLNVVRAVRGTTGIEGANLTEDEVGAILDAGPEDEPVLGDARAREEAEARNAARAMDYIRRTVNEAPEQDLTEQHVREIHWLTTDGIDYRRNVPGAYRDHPVTAGDYQAPSPQEVGDLMARFFAWFSESRDRDRWPECIRAVAAHFYLISIHPFGDGNGRTSRAVESFLLYRSGINSLGFYSLANFYYLHRPEYLEMLTRARFVFGREDSEFVDLTEFSKFALGGLRDELELVRTETAGFLRSLAIADYARETLRKDGQLRSRVGERQLQLVRLAIGSPIPMAALRRREHAAAALYAGATNKTLTRDINALREQALVYVANGQLHANVALMNQFTESPSE